MREKQSVTSVVTHADGSTRLQTIRRELHPRYYNVVDKLGKKTGVPVVLNKSFNI
ncbi:carbamoyltransferase C-terminal domain-containing protein [Flagellimonas sediminis]|uniref:Carbamoyltransferase C-terminal domain-containing protein n=1 Tax=Flagellimonas sediminis TaxID=2696468 RepID=A0A6I5KPH6_9FLAO|nr:hypothetical protein [Allomuricauda sediminis]